MNQKFRFFILLGVLFAIALGYYFFSTDRTDELVLVGTVDANQVIVSSKIAGRIEKLTVDEGSEVKVGDLIATIDSAELEAQKQAAQATLKSLQSQVTGSQATEKQAAGETSNQVQNARAQLQAARSALAEAQANFDLQQTDAKRIVELAKQGVASQQQRDQAEATLRASQARLQSAQDQARAAEAALQVAIARTNQAQAASSNVAAMRGQMASAQAQVEQAATRLGYANIVSPITGTISVRAARQGEVVNPGTPIVTIVDMDDTWVYAAIPETYAGKVLLGDELPIRMPGGEKLTGKVIAKSPEGDFATQRDVSRIKRDIKTVRLKLRIQNQAMKYVPGMTAEVLVPKSKLESK